jgi:ribosomal protein S12 methylthiotransferase
MGIRTTLITGFPGETLEQFNEMRDWVAEMKFDRLGVFTYSHEENTGAYVLEDNVPQEEKQRRADEIMSIQEGISQELNDRKIGSTQKILIDRKEGGFYVGRSEYDSPEVDNEVYVSAEEHFLRVGDFVNIKITSSTAFDLEGEPV